ncbi:phosphotransferase [Streptacidiphilus sp. MAP5-52]|uniref:phosphotransferase n=1 Tax=Streptacidiphilus sp. MAP5-52 TaxID=3156267 RepID=UPI003512B503
MTEHTHATSSTAGAAAMPSDTGEPGMTDWAAMQAGALTARRLYDQLNQQALGRTWDLGDFVLGFVGDVGDLAKLVMAHQGHRADVPVDAEKVAQELSDCLFSLIVIAHETGIALGDRFTADMATLSARVHAMLTTSNGTRGGAQGLQGVADRVEAPPAPGPQRYSEPVDAHLILRRGDEVLLARRAGSPYANGLFNLPSGHVDGPEEDIVDSVIREAREEAGITVEREDLRLAVIVQHLNPFGKQRTGWFLEATRWSGGEPRICEPELCTEMGFWPLDALPDKELVAYCHAGLDAYRHGQRVVLHRQQPGDTVAFQPDGPERSHILPFADSPDPVQPDPGPELLAFATRVAGPIAQAQDVSWPRPESRVWRLDRRDGSAVYLKQHQNPHFHAREVAGLTGPAQALGEHAPRLLGSDQVLRAVVVSPVRGRLLKHLALPRTDLAEVYRRLGSLVRQFHDANPPLPGPTPTGYRAKLDRHLEAARAHLGPGDEDLVRALAGRLDHLPPFDHVPTIGDLAERNVLVTEDLTVGLIDFERSEPGPAVRDVVRLADEWAHRPELETAFWAGYGRALTQAEAELLPVLEALDAVSGIAWGSADGGRDRHVVQRGQRTLARLHTNARAQGQ